METADKILEEVTTATTPEAKEQAKQKFRNQVNKDHERRAQESADKAREHNVEVDREKEKETIASAKKACADVTASWDLALKDLIPALSDSTYARGPAWALGAILHDMEEELNRRTYHKVKEREKATVALLSKMSRERTQAVSHQAKSLETTTLNLKRDRDAEIKKATQEIRERYSRLISDAEKAQGEKLESFKTREQQVTAEFDDAKTTIHAEQAVIAKAILDLKNVFSVKQ